MKQELLRPRASGANPTSASLVNQPFTAFALLGMLVPLLALLPITHDAIWQIWIGRQMLAGSELYRDIIEVNPPLWFWIAEPLAALDADARLTIIFFFITVIAAALYLIPAQFRIASLAVLLLVPLHDFGQREHFALIATLPYVFAISARTRGEVPPHAILIGLMAGVGLCLKPHFLLLPILLEILLWRHRHGRPESIALLAFVATYAVAIPLFAPAFLSDGLPMVFRFYGPFGQQPNYVALVIVLALTGGGIFFGKRSIGPESRALLLASLAFIPAVLVQSKGFPYHSIPVRGYLALAIIVDLIRSRGSPFADSLLVGSAIMCGLPMGVYHNGFQSEVEQHLVGVRPGTSIIVVASNPSMAWPAVAQHGLVWRLHAFSTWQINSVVRDPSLLRDVRRIYSRDFAKNPEVLIIDRRPVVGDVAHAMLPPGYLKCYSLRRRTKLMESYERTC